VALFAGYTDFRRCNQTPPIVCAGNHERVCSLIAKDFERQYSIWANDLALTFPQTIIYDLIDEGVLSSSWSGVTVTEIGFGSPGQFIKLKEYYDRGHS
jgi:hypothetical protein